MARESRNQRRMRRHHRVRQKVVGTAQRPRLNVFRSLSHLYAQVIDDMEGTTLTSASTLDESLRPQTPELTKMEQARLVGQLIAERAKELGVTQVVFDRGGYQYHGRVRAFAEAVREAGLDF